MVLAQPGLERCAVAAGAFETAVRRRVLSFAEDRVQPVEVESGMELGAWRVRDAMRWPAVDVVGFSGEMLAGLDVPVARADDVRVAVGGTCHVCTDRRCDGRTTPDGQAAAFAEVVLHVDDIERAGHDDTSA